MLADQRFAKNPSMEFVFRTSIFFYVFMNTRYISVIQFKNLISTLNTDLIECAKNIINLHGGEISVRSDGGETEFEFTLPLAKI